jgi:putative hydrolase of the HAD superfamily
MINLKGIKNIFFDLGGVLIDLNKEKCIEEFRKLGITDIEEQIGKSFKSGLFYKLEEGSITPEEFRDNIRMMTTGKVTDKAIDFAWNSFLQSIPEPKLTLLRNLKSHFRVFMVSNTNKIHFDYMIKHSFAADKGYNMSDYFEKCYLSFEMHVAKPDRAFFDYVISDSGILPANSLFMDDSIENINAAQKLGFQTYLVSEKEDYTRIFLL